MHFNPKILSSLISTDWVENTRLLSSGVKIEQALLRMVVGPPSSLLGKMEKPGRDDFFTGKKGSGSSLHGNYFFLFVVFFLYGCMGGEGKIELEGYIDTNPGGVGTVSGSFSYSSQFVNSSTDLAVAITSDGGFPVTLGDISNSGLGLDPPFSLSLASACVTGQVLAPNSSCDIVINYNPITSGDFSDTVELEFFDGGLNQVLMIPISGTTTGDWYQEAYIKAANNNINDFFGNSVSLSGDTLAVGSNYEDSNQTTITNGATASSDNSNGASGAVYIYKRSGNSWAQEAYIKASNNDSTDVFGDSISISGDTLAVGAYLEDSNETTITNGATASVDNSNGSSGAVYIYKRSGNSWAQEAYIKASNNNSDDMFGQKVAISSDTLAVGVRREDSNQTTITNGATASSDNSNSNSGAVYIYKRGASSWAQEAYIKASNNGGYDYFGGSISIGGDTLAVGANSEDSNQTTITNGTTASSNNSNSSSGAVYIYRRSGSTWAQEAYIKASNNNSLDYFGGGVSISGDTLAVAATGEDSNEITITNGTTASGDDSNSNSGAVYIYKRSAATWAQEAYIKADNNDSGDNFGYTVSINGNTLAVGVANEDSNQTTITNGTTASSDNSNADSGAVYIYKRSAATWAQEAYIKAYNNGDFDKFGYSIAISGDTLAVGASYEDSNETTITNGATATGDNSNSNSGAVFIYRNYVRLFEVPELYAISDSSSVTLTWVKSGGTAIGYEFSYQSGATAPADCDTGTLVDAGDVSTFQEFGLTASTTYSFRVCSYEDGVVESDGMVITITTAP